tara:strand:+ start:627 stop:1835 length:1209 start_codon:yes stop_codon:yes gene_type:complete
MAGFGTPIRLILDDDQKTAIELTAVSMAMSVDRGVGGAPIPFTGGKRFGVDLNLVSSTIIIDGIFTDDDDNPRSTTSVAASAIIEFNISTTQQFQDTPENADDANNIKDIIGKTLTMQNTTGTEYVVTFTEASSGTVGTGATSGSTTATVLVKNTSTGAIATSAQLASGLVQAIGTFSGTPFSATASESHYGSTYGNSKVTITQSTTGTMNNKQNLFFNPTGHYTPYSERFSGGIDGTVISAKSAGDKVQDLYGILHNTSRGGVAKFAAFGAVAAAAVTGPAGLILAGLAGGVAAGGVAAIQDKFKLNDDYPIALQIPYNSTIKAANGDKYTVRNFLIRTGIRSKSQKTSEGNDQSAGVTFSTTNNTTGIQGTVSKFDIGYDAGDSVYTFQMIFTPIDFIIS